MSTTKPDARLLIPDKKLIEEATVTTTYAQDGAYSGMGIPASTNEGSMTSFAHGTPDTATNYYQICTASGGVLNGGTWAWNRGEETTDQEDLLGHSDFRYIHDIRDVTAMGGDGSGFDCLGLTACYSPQLNKEFIYFSNYPTSDGEIRCYHRTVSDVDTAWTSQTISNIAYDFWKDARLNLNVEVLDDGSFRMLVPRGRDLDMWYSDDGLSWRLLCDTIFVRFGRTHPQYHLINLGRMTILHTRMATSGGYIRFVCVGIMVSPRKSIGGDSAAGGEGREDGMGRQAAADELQMEATQVTLSAVSSDRGSTWKISSIPDGPSIPQMAMPNTSSPISPTACGSMLKNNAAWQLTGVGDGGGSFILAIKVAQNTVAGFYASGMEDWIHENRLTLEFDWDPWGKSVTFDNVAVGTGTDYIFLLLTGYTENSFQNGVAYDGAWMLLTLDRRKALSGQMWKRSGVWSNRQVHKSRLPARPKLYSIGSECAMVCNLYSAANGGATAINSYCRLLGEWSKQPISESYLPGWSPAFMPREEYQPNTVLWDRYEWLAVYGSPAYSLYGNPNTVVTHVNNSTSGYVTDKGDYYTIVNHNAEMMQNMWTYKDAQTMPTQVSWSYRPTSGSGYPQGMLAEASFKVPSSTHPDGYVGLQFSTITSVHNGNDTRQSIRIFINKTEIVIRDGLGAADKATLTPSPSTYGATPFFNHYWIIRIGFEADPDDTVDGRMLTVLLRRPDKQEWLFVSTNLNSFVEDPYPNGTQYEAQHASWGHISALPPPGGSVTSSWRWCRMHAGSDLCQTRQTGSKSSGAYASYSRLSAMRGAEFTPFGRMMDDGILSYWGGGGAMDSDTYNVSTQYQYASKQTLLPSPSMVWASTDATDTDREVIYQLPNTTDRFVHDMFSVINTNAYEVTVSYSDDGISYSGVTTESVEYLNTCTVSAVSGDVITFTSSGTNPPYDAEVYDDSITRRYIRIIASNDTAEVPNDSTYAVVMHRGDKIRIDEAFPAASSMVSTTFKIISGRAVFAYASAQTGRFMKVGFKVGYPRNSTFKVGVVTAGMKLDLTVPMEWEHAETDSSNVQTNVSSSGIKNTYVNGNPRRTLSGGIIGDIDRWRQTFRHVLREIDFVNHPVVLQLDDLNSTDPDLIYYGRLAGSYTGKNDGWRIMDGKWHRIGDTTLSIEEEV